MVVGPLRLIIACLFLAVVMPPAFAQTLPPCCGGDSSRTATALETTVEFRGAMGEQLRFLLLSNGDAALYAPQMIIGRSRGQRFMSINDNGRWITAPPELWLQALEGTPTSVAALRRRFSFLADAPMTRTGATRTIAGIVGDVYNVPSLTGGRREAVFSRDPSLARVAEAYYDIFDVVPAEGSMAHVQAATRNAGFSLAHRDCCGVIGPSRESWQPRH